jgi:hypothetical protein
VAIAPFPAAGTEPNGGSPTGEEVDMIVSVALMLTLVLLLMVIDRMRQ